MPDGSPCLDLNAGYARTCLRASSVAVSGPRYWNTLQPLDSRNKLWFQRHLKMFLHFKDTLKFFLFLPVYKFESTLAAVSVRRTKVGLFFRSFFLFHFVFSI